MPGGCAMQGNFLSDPTVDYNDFLALYNNFGTSITGPAYVPTPDQLAILQNVLTTHEVPEPASLLFLALGAAIVMTARRKRGA